MNYAHVNTLRTYCVNMLLNEQSRHRIAFVRIPRC